MSAIQMKKLQALLDRQVGKGGIRNIVAAVQSADRSTDFRGAAGHRQTSARARP